MSGCSTSPALPEPPAPAESRSVPAEPPPQEKVCPPCADQTHEIVRLKQELAARDAEVRELRARQREQVKIVQESNRQVIRARVKLRRLATQADAASYIAEVEVALQSLRASPQAGSCAPLIAIAQALLASASAPFDRGQYGDAIDRAAQAEELVTALSDHVRSAGATRASEVPFPSRLALELSLDSKLRQRPQARASTMGVLKKGTPLTGYAFKEPWVQVRAPDGRIGWVDQSALALAQPGPP